MAMRRPGVESWMMKNSLLRNNCHNMMMCWTANRSPMTCLPTIPGYLRTKLRKKLSTKLRTILRKISNATINPRVSLKMRASQT